jgi:hypothetical protein
MGPVADRVRHGIRDLAQLLTAGRRLLLHLTGHRSNRVRGPGLARKSPFPVLSWLLTL